MTPSNSPIYDFIFAGGGLAGLSLAYRLARPGSPFRDSRMLIVDPEPKDHNDRTWCFWSDAPTPFDELVHRSWQRLRLLTDERSQVLELKHYRYQMIRAVDFYAHVHRALEALPNVSFLRGRVARLEEGRDAGGVVVGSKTYAGRWVFDSRFRCVDGMRALQAVQATGDRSGDGLWSPERAAGRRRPQAKSEAGLFVPYHNLIQRFMGWVVETPEPAFDPSAATLFDFRGLRGSTWRFIYMLPLSERQALVEYVTLCKEDSEQVLVNYLRRECGVKNYRVVGREGGANPLSDRPFQRRLGPHLMAIGTAGGRVKPSSGYAFTRIQKDSDAIVRSLERRGHPFDVPGDSGHYRMCDATLLDILQRRGDLANSLLQRLFQRNPPERVLRFLDERASPLENVALFLSMPPRLFVPAVWRQVISGNW